MEQWVKSGQAGHDAVGTISLEDDDGRVLCYEAGAQKHIEWTTNNSGVYGHASGLNYASLLRWWRASAGPVS